MRWYWGEFNKLSQVDSTSRVPVMDRDEDQRWRWLTVVPGSISIHVPLLGARMCLISTSATSNNDNHNDYSRAGFSRIEIDAHRVVQREQGTLIAAKTDGG